MLRTLKALGFAALVGAASLSPVGPGAVQPAAHAAEPADDAGAFITELGDKAIGALTDKSLEADVRRERFRTLLNEGLDIDYVGQFVLGAYRRRADEQQMEQFLDLLEDNIVQNYAWRFRNYNGEHLTLLNVRDGSRDTQIVETELAQRGDAPPIRVDWRVHRKDGAFKVIDIVVEGISMMVTQRDEYVGFMRSNGGVDALIEALRKQNAALAERYQNG